MTAHRKKQSVEGQVQLYKHEGPTQMRLQVAWCYVAVILQLTTLALVTPSRTY